MQTAKLNYKSEAGAFLERGADTTTRIENAIAPPVRQVVMYHPASRLKVAGHVSRLLFAAVLTAPMRYFDPTCDALRSGTYSFLFRAPTRWGRRLSMLEARELAMQVLENAERRLREERIAEAKLYSTLWDTD